MNMKKTNTLKGVNSMPAGTRIVTYICLAWRKRMRRGCWVPQPVAVRGESCQHAACGFGELYQVLL